MEIPEWHLATMLFKTLLSRHFLLTGDAKCWQNSQRMISIQSAISQSPCPQLRLVWLSHRNNSFMIDIDDRQIQCALSEWETGEHHNKDFSSHRYAVLYRKFLLYIQSLEGSRRAQLANVQRTITRAGLWVLSTLLILFVASLLTHTIQGCSLAKFYGIRYDDLLGLIAHGIMANCLFIIRSQGCI